MPESTELISYDSKGLNYRNNRESARLKRLAKSLYDGDEKAWEELYLLMYDPIAGFINRIIRSEEEAYDISQDLFITLWEHRTKIDPEKNIKGYLFTMAKGMSYKFLRDKVIGKEMASLSDMPNISLQDIAPDDIVMADETKLIIAIALERMPPQRKKVFEMSRYEGQSYDEIAARLNISKRTVERHIYDASKQLKELIYLAMAFIALQGIIN